MEMDRLRFDRSRRLDVCSLARLISLAISSYDCWREDYISTPLCGPPDLEQIDRQDYRRVFSSEHIYS